jgi:hypothetical protein
MQLKTDEKTTFTFARARPRDKGHQEEETTMNYKRATVVAALAGSLIVMAVALARPTVFPLG